MIDVATIAEEEDEPALPPSVARLFPPKIAAPAAGVRVVFPPGTGPKTPRLVWSWAELKAELAKWEDET